MSHWPWSMLLWPASLMVGCDTAPAVPPASLPALDATAPARTATATLALG